MTNNVNNWPQMITSGVTSDNKLFSLNEILMYCVSPKNIKYFIQNWLVKEKGCIQNSGLLGMFNLPFSCYIYLVSMKRINTS